MAGRYFDSLTIKLYEENLSLIKLFVNSLNDKSLSRISFERSDYRQELRIKLYKTIIQYLKLTIKGETTGAKDIRWFCYTALKNHSINMLKKIKNLNGAQGLESVIDNIQFSCKEYEDKIDRMRYIGGKKLFDYEHFYLGGKDVLSYLSGRQRTVFKLKLLGYKEKEIAFHFNMPIGTVKTYIKKSRSLLQKKLKSLFSGDKEVEKKFIY